MILSKLKKLKTLIMTFPCNQINIFLSGDLMKLYSKGWHYSEQPINLFSIISLGLNVNVIALDYIKNMITNITIKEMVNGYFRIDDDEDGLSLEWIIKNSHFEEKVLSI